MIVRCGACRTEFQVPGAGRFACPTCGATNEVRGNETGGMAPPPGPAGPPPGGPGLAGVSPPPAPEPPPANVSRVGCPACSFEFFVGEIDVASCPNCGTEVTVGAGDGEATG